MRPAATVLIPTHNHGPLLRASVASALWQSVPVEVFVVGDGVTDETRDILGEITRTDSRVRFFDYPKGPRHGEIFRHEVLKHASGRIICYLSDDDLFLQHHVEDMSKLLDEADFAHALAVEARLDGGISAWTTDLANPIYRRETLRGGNRIPFSAGAHTLEFYHQLEEGWTSAPEGIPTDLYMWQKFVRHPGCRFRSGSNPSVVVFPSPQRRHLSPNERLRELQEWTDRVAGPRGIQALKELVLAQKVAEAAEMNARFVEAVHTGVMQQDPMFQVFFPRPGGYTELASARFCVRPGSWQRITVTFQCPQSGLEVRIDPSDRPCLIELRQVILRSSNGAVLWQLTEKTARKMRLAGTAIPISRKGVVTILSDGNDPQIVLPPVTMRRDHDEAQLDLMVRLDLDLKRLTRLLSDHLQYRRH